MCTVTFIPSAEGYILSTNRDEKISRARVEWPVETIKDNYRILYPRDLSGMGTWIAADNRNNAVCLLNGAFSSHIPREKYRHSRGLIVTGIFDFNSIQDFVDSYNLDDIEPFTLVIVWNEQLLEFKWDGTKKYLINHDWRKPKIWSSATLYSPEIAKLRESWFEEWIMDEGVGIIDTSKILSFHNSEHYGNPEFSIRMKRDWIQTISTTSVTSAANELVMQYIDLVSGFAGFSKMKLLS